MPFLILFLILYIGYTVLSLKSERFFPYCYRIIEDENKKEKWLKMKIISECFVVSAFVLFLVTISLDMFSLISYTAQSYVLALGIILLIISLIINLVNNKKNSGVFGFTFFKK